MRRLSQPFPLLAAAVVLAAMQVGCASKPPADDPDAVSEYNQTNDPLEPTNRVFYAVNDGLDTVILRPLAVAYRYILPETVRSHTHNVLTNLSQPVTLFNDILQARSRRAGDSRGRRGETPALPLSWPAISAVISLTGCTGTCRFSSSMKARRASLI